MYGITGTPACCVLSFQIQPYVSLFRRRFWEIFFLFLAPWQDLLSSLLFSLQILFFFLSQPHGIVESSQVVHRLFLCALGWYHFLSLTYSTFFLYFFTSKVYLSLTYLVVTLKFISSREFSKKAILSQNCLLQRFRAPWFYV